MGQETKQLAGFQREINVLQSPAGAAIAMPQLLDFKKWYPGQPDRLLELRTRESPPTVSLELRSLKPKRSAAAPAQDCFTFKFFRAPAGNK